MTEPPTTVIIDAGPALTFIAAGEHALLMAVVGHKCARLCAPATVASEIERKCNEHGRFNGRHNAVFAAMVRDGDITQLEDDIDDPQLVAAAEKVAGMSLVERITTSKDLGETMVVAHALSLQANGVRVVVLIDDLGGQAMAQQQGIPLTSTLGILLQAARLGLVVHRGDMKVIYERLARYDDGLPSWATTYTERLRDRALYSSGPGA